MNRITWIFAFLAMALVTLSIDSLKAQSAEPAISILGGSDAGITGQTTRFGLHFSPLEDIDVTAFGIYDRQDDGLAADMLVGLFKTNPQGNDGVELVRATIPAGTSATLIDRFRYVDLATPERLLAGEKYMLGTIYLASTIDDIFKGTLRSENSLLNADKTFNAVLSGVAGSAGQSDSWTDIDWMFPGVGPGPHISANFRFTVVPEPSTIFIALNLTALLISYRNCGEFRN